MAAVLLLLPARAERRADVADVLARMPGGARETQATWLFDAAREAGDAHLAFELMSEAARRFQGPGTARVQLWKVRFFMAAGDTASALRELDSVRDAPEVAPERAYWATVLGRREAGGHATRAGTLPPWDLMRDIAELGTGGGGSRQVRAALELEGAARRWGLLGPWLWRLVRSESPVLREAAQTIAGAPHASLVAAPEMAELREWIGGSDGSRDGRAAADLTEPESLRAGRPAFAVEVGTFQDADPARELVRELAGHGFEAYLAASSGPDGEALHHVRVGRECTRAAAESLGTALGSQLMLSYQIVAEGGPEPAAPTPAGGAPGDSVPPAMSAEPDTAGPDSR